MSRSFISYASALVTAVLLLVSCAEPAHVPISSPTAGASVQPSAQIQPASPTQEALTAWIDDAYPLDNFPSNGALIFHFSHSIYGVGEARPFSIVPEVAGTYTWSENKQILTFTPAAGAFREGRSYVLMLHRNLKGAGGLTFSSTQRWTIDIGDAYAVLIPTPTPGPTHTPAPKPPHIISRMPAGGNLLIRDLTVRLTFSVEMDRESVATALSVTPEFNYNLRWEENVLFIESAAQLAIGTTYQFSIDESARSAAGIAFDRPYTWRYAAPPALSSASYPTLSLPDMPITLYFNFPIAHDSFTASVRIEPDIPGEFLWDNSGLIATFQPSRKLPASTQIIFSFDEPMETQDGESFPPPPPISFITPPPVVLAIPRGRDVNPASAVQIVFDRPMDRNTTSAAFRISPDTPGEITWNETTLTFSPDEGRLMNNTSYRISIEASALDSSGSPIMPEPFSWSFTTGIYRPVVNFGEFGPNAQVLDADGRRAIQFVLTESANNLSVRFDLYQMDISEFVSRYSSGFRGVAGWEAPVLIPTDDLARQASFFVDVSGDGYQVFEAYIPANVPLGMYILNMKTGELVNGQLIIIISRHTLMLKQAEGELTAWLTDINGTNSLSNAVAGASIYVYARDGRLIQSGTTDESGLFRTEIAQNPEPLIVLAQAGNDVTATGLSWEWDNAYGAWMWWWQPMSVTRKFSAHIYTDRPIYKPGQSVFFKAVIRGDSDAILSLPPAGTPVTVRIRDARNNVVITLEMLTTPFGTVNGEFAIAEGAMLGDYNIEISWNSGLLQQIFKVQEYRKPDMQVTVTTDAPYYIEGDKITIHVDTRYFFGEPVPNAKLTIQKYVRTLGYYDWWAGEYIEGQDWVKPWDAKTVSGVTDENGQYTFSLPAEVFWGRDSYYTDWRSSQSATTWGIEVTADDGSHQVVSGFGAVTVYAAAEEITVDTGGDLKKPGEPFLLEALVQDNDGFPVDGRELSVELRRWSYTDYDYSKIIQSQKMTTAPDGRASVNFTPLEPGYYQLRVNGTDIRGKEIEYRTYLYIFSETDFWAREQTTELQITSEFNSYAPGETARLLVESAFSGPALLTFERGTVREEIAVRLTAPLTVLEVPIHADYAPNIFIAVNAYVAVDPSIENKEWVFESLADSRLVTAVVEVQVPVVDKVLLVSITPDKQSYAAREKATFTIRVTDKAGVPVQAEVSLALVDEAIFSLSDELSGPILASFYDRRDHIVRTYDSLALSRVLMYGGMGGGGDEGLLSGRPRSDFPDTAAWFPNLVTNENGVVVVTVNLPDSLTTWRLTAKATTGDSHEFGEATANFLTQQQVIVRPILPGTLTAGDQFMLSAFVHNYSDETHLLQIGFEQDESRLLQLIDGEPLAVSLGPGEQRMVGWMVKALSSGEAQVTVSVSYWNAGWADAVSLPLQIRPLAVPDLTTITGDFRGAYETSLIWPRSALEMSTVRVELSRSIAGTLLTGLDYLTGFPYGCVEQTMSKALPNAVVGRALFQLGVSDPTFAADLPPQINAGLQRLYGFQHNDGGWGWWYDDATDAYQTAWVVFGLAVTAQAGYEVDPGVVERGAAWLNENLGQMDVRTQAFALYALAISRHGNLDATKGLYELSFDDLDTFSRAALALAFHELGESRQARAIVNALAETATRTNGEVYWAGEDHDGYYHQKTMSSATRTTALALSAFVKIRPQHALEPGLVRYLMGQRTQQGWGTTNETSFTILALTDHLLAAEIGTAQTRYEVELNGVVLSAGNLGPGEPAVSIEIPAEKMRPGRNSLVIRQDGLQPMYYTVNSRVYLPQKEIAAAGEVDVTRKYVNPKTNRLLETILPGQLVKIVLTVQLTDTASYMLVEDNLPGGLEALNENLNTTSFIAQAFDENGEVYEGFTWRELGYNHKEIRPGRVTFFITEMTAGTHTFSYLARATHSGTFVAMPAEASAMYDLATWGRSQSTVLTIGD